MIAYLQELDSAGDPAYAYAYACAYTYDVTAGFVF